MLGQKQDIQIEVGGRLPIQMSYPHAFAFLDGTPEPKSRRDLERLVRLLAYDMVSIQGARGVDPAGVYAYCLRVIHQVFSKGNHEWEWEWNHLRLRSSPCDEEKFHQSVHVPAKEEPRKTPELCQWASRINQGEVPRWGLADEHSPLAYPEPSDAICAAATMALEATHAICNPVHVSIWLENEANERLLIEFWTEKTNKYSGLRK